MNPKLFICGLLILPALATSSAWAMAPVEKDNLVVEGVRMPAWVEYENGTRDALIIGQALDNKDKIHTGANSRVMLRLADGSAIKLGENATLALDDLGQKKLESQKNLVTASLDVLVGAFRFTTGLLAKSTDERDVKVHLLTMTVGIRGTDIWGKVASDQQTLALIDGSITVVADDGTAFTMDKPMTMHTATTNGAAEVAMYPEQFKTLALETDIPTGQGASARGGHWKIYVGKFDNQDDALALYDKFRLAGYGARIWPVKTSGGTLVYYVRIPYLPSQKEADVLAQQIKDANLVADTTIQRY